MWEGKIEIDSPVTHAVGSNHVSGRHAFHEACSIAHDAVLRLLVASGSSPLFDLTRTTDWRDP